MTPQADLADTGLPSEIAAIGNGLDQYLSQRMYTILSRRHIPCILRLLLAVAEC